jgi:predicted nucleotidyltransferase
VRSMTSDAVHLVGRFVASRHPAAIAAILAGSRARGAASSASDYDVILVFESLPNGRGGK